MRRALLLLLPVVVGGCAMADGTAAVDITLVADSSLADATVASLRRLDLSVRGVEVAQASYPLAHPFQDQREERVVYRPGISSGEITIRAEALDASGELVASGEATVTLAGGQEVAAMVLLAAPGPDAGIPADLMGGDGGDDALASCVEGTVCAPTSNPCDSPGVCSNGVCGPITHKPAGAVCSTASDPCHTDGSCDGLGTCGGQGVRPDGYGYDTDPLDRCCGGKPVRVDTAQNCGACGIDCNGGQCQRLYNQLYCTCGSNAQCWSGCCSTFYGTPYTCSAGNCSTNQPIACPGNAINGNNPIGPFYCHY